MKTLLFVYNPISGKGLLKPKVGEIIDMFVKADYLPVVYPTQQAGEAATMVRDFEGQYDMVVCSGGDGTLDEVVTAMMDCQVKTPVGYIPSGSTNDFAKSLKIPVNMIKAADIAINGEIFHCDVGSFNQDTFVYIAAFGMFTDISYGTPQGVKNVLGHMAYVLEGMKRLYSIPSFHMKITYDDTVLEGDYLFGMITNSRSVGGFKTIVGKNVVFDDGEFEVTLIKNPDTIMELQEIIASLLIEQINTKYMESFSTSKLVIESQEDVAWTLDGEYGGLHNKVVIKNRNKALDIMVDPKHKKSLMKKQAPKTKKLTLPKLPITKDIIETISK